MRARDSSSGAERQVHSGRFRLPGGCRRRIVGDEARKVIDLVWAIAPPLARPDSCELIARLKVESERQLPERLVCVFRISYLRNELPSDVVLKGRPISPVPGAPLEQQHVAALREVHIV